jgi:hypothetical protein
MPKSIEPLVAAIRSGNKRQFVSARYALAEEGSAIAIRQQQLARAPLAGLPLQFILFIDCDLTLSSLTGANLLAVGFLRCNFNNVDLRSCRGVIDAERCDFSGARWNDGTFLGGTGDTPPSTLAACDIGAPLRRFLAGQGVAFPQRLSTQRRALYQEACRADAWS